MASLFRPQFTKLDKATGQRVKKTCKVWYARWRDASGRLQQKPLHRNKSVAQLMLADLMRGEDAPKETGDLTAILETWEAAQLARGCTEAEVRTTLYRARAVVTGCGWKVLADMDCDQAAAFLASLQPRLSACTRNCYCASIKSFARWLVSTGKMKRHPFAELRFVSTAADRRHDRRALTPDEVQRLLAASYDSKTVFRGLTGTDRHALYLCALGTGFRVSELAALVPEWFELDARPPVVRLPARSTKNGRPAQQPIAHDLVAYFRAYLAGRPLGEAVWPGNWIYDAAEMIKNDLEAAGIPYVVEGPDGPLFADAHSLRHAYIASLDKPDITVKQAMTLARLADIKLLMRIYGRARLADLASAVNSACSPLARASGADSARIPAGSGETSPPPPATVAG